MELSEVIFQNTYIIKSNLNEALDNNRVSLDLNQVDHVSHWVLYTTLTVKFIMFDFYKY